MNRPTKVVLTRLTDGEDTYLEKAAEKNEISVSEYLRRLVLRDMQKGGLKIVGFRINGCGASEEEESR